MQYCYIWQTLLVMSKTLMKPNIKYKTTNLSSETKIELYKAMLKPRLIEEKMLILLRQGKIVNGFMVLGKKLYLLVLHWLCKRKNIFYQCTEILVFLQAVTFLYTGFLVNGKARATVLQKVEIVRFTLVLKSLILLV